ncbi:MAG: DUF4149 domain-containing protein [Gammaproteobacteria bacterium]|nr:DUF4149 domain-containing protein [Gammaproteobacteria bacterium]
MFGNSVKRLEQLLLALWTGSMVGVGYIAAPVLFKTLDDRKLAGMLAGNMFGVIFIAGSVIGLVLLLLLIGRLGRSVFAQWRFWVLLVMWSLAMASLFVVQPMMAELKSQGLLPGSEAAKQFGMMHGVSSVMYMLTSLGGVVLVWAGLRKSEVNRPRSAIGGHI